MGTMGIRFFSLIVIFNFSFFAWSNGHNTLRPGMILDKQLKEFLLENKKVPGLALAVITSKEILYKKTFGWNSIDHKIPLGDDTLFRIASLSKTFTTLGVLRLVEQNKLNLDNPIINYLLGEKWYQPKSLDPQKDNWKNQITLRHLLSHSSGLQKGSGTNAWMDVSVHTTAAYPSAKRMKENFNNVFIRFEPGSSVGYSNVGLFLASFIVAKYSDIKMDSYEDRFQTFM